MFAAFIPSKESGECHPLTVTRPLSAIPLANKPLRYWVSCTLHDAGFSLGDGTLVNELTAYLYDNVWLDPSDARLIATQTEPMLLRTTDGRLLGAIGRQSHDILPALTLRFSWPIFYPWDLLKLNEQLIGEIVDSAIEGEISPLASITGTLHLGTGSRILPGVYLEGTVLIGQNCKIGPNAYLRGPLAIDDDCHVGQSVEIKASILMRKVAVGHLSYVGDSIIGEGCNFGAGTITANFRHDSQNHRSMVNGALVDTGRRKFGAILGDGVHTGIHTSIYPGRKLWPHTSTRPGQIVQKDLLA